MFFSLVMAKPIEGLSEARYFPVDLPSGAMNSPVSELNFNAGPRKFASRLLEAYNLWD
jgi:hypothetical protein